MQNLNKWIYRIVLAVTITLIVILTRHYHKLEVQALEQENLHIKKETCRNLHQQKNRIVLTHENLVSDLIAQYSNAGKLEAMQKRKKNVSEEEMIVVYNKIDETETKIKEQEQQSREIRWKIANCE